MGKPSASLLVLAATLALAGCSQRTPTVERYAKEGVEFSHGSDWRVESDEPSKENPDVRIVSLEGPQDAIVMIILNPAGNSGTLEKFAAAVAKGRATNIKRTFTVGSIEAGDASTGTSGATTQNVGGQSIAGIRQQFAVTLLGMDVPHEASFYLVESPRHHTYVMTQTASETANEARAGWQPILESLHIE